MLQKLEEKVVVGGHALEEAEKEKAKAYREFELKIKA